MIKGEEEKEEGYVSFFLLNRGFSKFFICVTLAPDYPQCNLTTSNESYSM